MKRLLLLLAAMAIVGLPAAAFANTITFQAPVTAGNANSSTSNPNLASYQGGTNQFDLDHHLAYTLRLDNINLPAGQVISGATLTFAKMRNWDGYANMLFVHLFDTALNANVASFNEASGSPVTNIFDNFSTSNPLIDAGTGNTFLGSHSFTNTSSQTWTITFTPAQLAILGAYIANGNNLAFGFDPDCHFWNNGIVFTINTVGATLPEPTTLALLGSGLAALYLRRRKQRKSI